jgi:hypothetical protein
VKNNEAFILSVNLWQKIIQCKVRNKAIYFFIYFFLFTGFKVWAQQVPDTAFQYSIKQTAYKDTAGPVIFIDEAHNNFHTCNGRYFAFSKLLEQDGYKVKSLTNSISSKKFLTKCKILVIANALHESNKNSWILPNPSAFYQEELELIHDWVHEGGRLLLIADHMPFAGAAYDLANVFGFQFLNGFAITGNEFGPSTFKYSDSTLHKSEVTQGYIENEQIDSVVTFTGSAFQSPPTAINILGFKNSHRSLQPDTAWKFNELTPEKNLGGFHQGAIVKVGKGKVAVFGEAAMFTAQVVNENYKVGFNSDAAPDNAQFLLNVIHWLDK